MSLKDFISIVAFINSPESSRAQKVFVWTVRGMILLLFLVVLASLYSSLTGSESHWVLVGIIFLLLLILVTISMLVSTGIETVEIGKAAVKDLQADAQKHGVSWRLFFKSIWKKETLKASLLSVGIFLILGMILQLDNLVMAVITALVLSLVVHGYLTARRLNGKSN